MAREKQYVFSARTTKEGLTILNELKTKLGTSWDKLIIDAVCTKYDLDREVMALPKVEKPTKVTKLETEKAKKFKAKAPA